MDRGHAQLSGAPFAPGSISLRAYPHDELDPVARVAELRAQAALAIEHGFDGVMTSEHHGGFPGYLPNPLQLAGFLLDAMPRGWAAPCPLLLPLRPAALVAEETAWLAARFPGRVGLGVAAGALAADFEIMGTEMHGLTARFAAALATLTAALRGDASEPLVSDAAIRRCATAPVPVLSAAASATAARRAAAVGAGLLFDSLVTATRVRALVDAYRSAGGRGPCVLVRRCWVGEPPVQPFADQTSVYRSYAPVAAPAHWGSDELLAEPAAEALARRIVGTVRAAGVDAVNVRVHVPGIDPAAAREQIVRLGAEVAPLVRGGFQHL